MMTKMDASRSRIRDAALKIYAERGAVDLNVSELAQIAGVARGTIYNNVSDPDGLFDDLISDLSKDMYEDVVARLGAATDPARRLSIGTRLIVKRAHDEPDLARFIVRFGLNNKALQTLLQEAPIQDLRSGIASGRYQIGQTSILSIAAMLAGSVLSAMSLVFEGHKGWREAGSELSALLLIALGVAPEEAWTISKEPLPEPE